MLSKPAAGPLPVDSSDARYSSNRNFRSYSTSSQHRPFTAFRSFGAMVDSMFTLLCIELNVSIGREGRGEVKEAVIERRSGDTMSLVSATSWDEFMFVDNP